MLLITEDIQDVNFITEDVGGIKNYFLTGTFLQAEVTNRNGRRYSKDLLEREVQRYNNNYISKNRALGEMGHPNGPGINLDRVSHMITELYANGNNYIGKAKILDTPYGKIVKNFMAEGIVLGVSSRGVGTLKPQNGYQLVQDDFMLATAADIVADPSAPDAFVRGIMEGNSNWQAEIFGQTANEFIDQQKKDFHRLRKINEETKLQAFQKFLNII